MSSKTRLTILESEVKNGELIIKKMGVIDGKTGSILRLAKITPELENFLKKCEICLDDYFEVMENPIVKKLINIFNCKI